MNSMSADSAEAATAPSATTGHARWNCFLYDAVESTNDLARSLSNFIEGKASVVVRSRRTFQAVIC